MSGKQNIELRDCLKRYFGFDSFKGNQEAVIRNVLDGKDTFVLMPTGGGKSLCYQLPALMMDGVAIGHFAADRADEKPSGCDADFQHGGRRGPFSELVAE